jgi:competence protein ComEA
MGDPTDTLTSSAALAPDPSDAQTPNGSAALETPPVVRASAPPVAPSEPLVPSETVESHFWLTRTDQVAFGLLCVVALGLLAVYWIRLSNWGTQTVEIERLPSRQYEFRIDANSATWVEWGQIQGIGDGLARRIVADREQNGPFHSVDDLARVKGIGPKTLEHLRPWVRVADESPPTEPVKRKRSKSRSKSRPKTTTKVQETQDQAG